jgi:hypothetical protein
VSRQEIEDRFTHHPPSNDTVVSTHEVTRAAVKRVAHKLDNLLPDSREKSLALTHLEQALFWANAAIARHCNE